MLETFPVSPWWCVAGVIFVLTTFAVSKLTRIVYNIVTEGKIQVNFNLKANVLAMFLGFTMSFISLCSFVFLAVNNVRGEALALVGFGTLVFMVGGWVVYAANIEYER